MTPQEKLENKLPESLHLRALEVIDRYRAKYDQRDADYFITGFGDNSLFQRFRRGTEGWKTATDDAETYNHFPRGWLDHHTGEMEPTGVGRVYLTFADRIGDEIETLLWQYALDGVHPFDWEPKSEDEDYKVGLGIQRLIYEYYDLSRQPA